MNIERLHRVLSELESDFNESKLIANLENVKTNLQNQINQPNEPTYQTHLVNSLNELYLKLDESSYNTYSPLLKETIKEISRDLKLGSELKSEVEEIFRSNTITPAKALEEIINIHNQLSSFYNSITNTLTGLKGLEIEKETLKPGECELGYSIPRKYIDNKLAHFRDEISELNFILNIVSEAVLGEKEEYKIKTISSSDFLLYVVLGIQVADVLSKAIERILNHYKQILEIKSLRNQLSEKGVPSKETHSIEKYANGIMETEIKKIAKEIIDENYKKTDNGRKNEIENGLVIALNKLANRFDNGFNVEIRVEPLPIPKDEKDQKAAEKTNLIIENIQERAEKIEYITNVSGQSILSLPEANKSKPAGNTA